MAGCSEKTYQQHSIRLDKRDLYRIADDVTQAFLTSPVAKAKSYKYFVFAPIKNETYDHIDTKRLADIIIARLTQNGFLFSEKDRHCSTEVPDAVFHGKISAIYQTNDRSKDMHYIFRLFLTDTESAQEFWSFSVNIRGKGTRALIGW